MKQLLLLNGPNLNLLGVREPDIYGAVTLQDIEQQVEEVCQRHGWKVKAFQSNHEGELIDQIHQARHDVAGIVFNPGAYTHTSVALRDAIASVGLPVIEVHLSNVHQRETFRHTSYIAPVAWGQVVGLGAMGYVLATQAFINQYS
ncbi:type II 3-dehydroquinate dehydratase [Pontibacillus litoralis]|uniref:3-dehydroquinate dehydratase n=1 Tax=Pontibacillus litoralis JSM 072002 TaxID=1385512 RepID=A0A0A5HZ16_9BACI|nr:type II 3-dehydroquinate dehydratase [Pontibacillus litoralis]KGX88852.1 3-dehydroquinate dehydratase [Pontibacillus litoralis JSM 072002]